MRARGTIWVWRYTRAVSLKANVEQHEEQQASRADGRMLRWEGHNNARRLAVVKAAIELIEESPVGLVDLKPEAIAARAGIARTVIYRYFTDRAELERHIRNFAVGMFRERFTSTVDFGKSLHEVIAEMLTEIVGWAADHPRLTEYLESSPQGVDAANPEIQDLKAAVADDLLRQLSLWTEFLRIDRSGLDVLVTGGVAMVEGSVLRWVRQAEPKPAAERIVTMLTTSVWGMIRAHAESSAIGLDPAKPLHAVITELAAVRTRQLGS
ncbi:TetR family transcriptional regulator [Nocardia brasiliensis]|uniref:TetR family transcriptional regulator n=1 Tax=Nocardia brasiliensis TaxID=37326 RepID=UPI003D94B688